MGIIQGITEFLPISSTAHLVLIPWFFGWSGLVESLSFDVALHLGTLISILICFWRDLIDIVTRKFHIAILILIGTIPAGIAGLALKHKIESTFRSPMLIALMLVLFGVVMYLAERGLKRRNIADLGMSSAVIIGLAQAIALIPGVSRSGITISAGLGVGLRRDEAARFSFLLSIPVVAGAALLEGRKLMKSPEQLDMPIVVAGVLASAITGVFAIKFLLRYLKSSTMNVFVIYRFILAAVIVLWAWLVA